MKRRHFLGAAALLSGCSALRIGTDDPALPRIVFVPGNNEDACMFTTLIWRFESNGYPPELLHALSYRNPAARSNSGGDDATPRPDRSSTAEVREDLHEFLAAIRSVDFARGGVSRKVVLIGHSRGGTAIRNRMRLYGADDVAAVVLCGAPNHGIVAFANRAPKNEFNGLGEFMQTLNAIPLSRYPNTQALTIRSTASDAFYQPDGRFVGLPGTATNVAADSPALEGATNLDFAGMDHLETALSARAFDAMYRFITGHAPSVTEIAPVRTVEFSGRALDRDAEGYLINRPPAGARLSIWKVAPESGARIGSALFDGAVGPDGSFGPIRVASTHYLEFVLACDGKRTTHIYRTPLRRSTRYLRVRPMSLAVFEKMDRVVVVHRSDGYIGEMRDTVRIDDFAPVPVPLGVNRFAPLPGQAIASTVARMASVTGRPGARVTAMLNGRALNFPLPPATQGAAPVTVAEFD